MTGRVFGKGADHDTQGYVRSPVSKTEYRGRSEVQCTRNVDAILT
jgi:hypothetical protein